MINNLLPIIEGQSLDATPYRLNFSNITSEYNNHDKNIYGVHGLDKNNKITTVGFYTDLLNRNKPIGTIIPIWDNDISDIQDLIDLDFWTIMDGSTIDDIDSPFNTVELPDLSEAYIVCSTSVINKDINGVYERDLTHSHDFEHQHAFTHGNHTLASHNHNTSVSACIGYGGNRVGSLPFINGSIHMATHISASSFTTGEKMTSIDYNSFTPSSYSNAIFKPVRVDIKTASTSTTLNSGVTTTFGENRSQSVNALFDDSLTTPISVKPRSIKCRYYLRYK